MKCSRVNRESQNRQIPYMMEESINNDVNNMMKMNIIEPSESPFCPPVVIVPKKYGKNRFCIDYRLLNSQTIFDSEPTPDSDGCFRNLRGISSFLQLICRRVICKLSLLSAQNKKTAFKTVKDYFNSE